MKDFKGKKLEGIVVAFFIIGAVGGIAFATAKMADNARWGGYLAGVEAVMALALYLMVTFATTPSRRRRNMRSKHGI
jgi:bacteriorhodopsin